MAGRQKAFDRTVDEGTAGARKLGAGVPSSPPHSSAERLRRAMLELRDKPSNARRSGAGRRIGSWRKRDEASWERRAGAFMLSVAIEDGAAHARATTALPLEIWAETTAPKKAQAAAEDWFRLLLRDAMGALRMPKSTGELRGTRRRSTTTRGGVPGANG